MDKGLEWIYLFMKKVLLGTILSLIFSGLQLSFATEIQLNAQIDSEINKDIEIEKAIQEREEASELYDTPVFLEQEETNLNLKSSDLSTTTNENNTFYNRIIKNVKDVYSLQIENTNTVPALLAESLTWDLKNGPVEKLHLWGSFGTMMNADFPQGNDSSVGYTSNNINILLNGKMRTGKEDFALMFDVTPSHRNFFQQFVQDAYFQTHRVKNHSILIGNSRPGVGYEGAQSPYTLPLVNRSQISRHFGSVRKVGVRVRSDYDYVNYDIGGYSSDTFFTEFMPGVEFDGWLSAKPLAKTNGKYGKLSTGAGIIAGDRHNVDFFVSGAYIGYEYKRFWLRSEFATANGSNGATGLTSKDREGWYATLGYHLTPQIEFITRYDEFDQDKKISHNNRREYTAGMNYYLKGQALKLILNYIYCQTQNQLDSHRLLLGTQLIL